MDSPDTPMKNSEFEVVFTAKGERRSLGRELRQSGGLFKQLFLRNLRVKYSNTAAGFGWVVLRPLLMMAVFTLVFAKLARVAGPDAPPYALLVFCGLVPWYYFAGAVGEATGSLLAEGPLISKVYFPKIIVPLVAVATNLVDLAAMLVILLVLFFFMQGVPPPAALGLVAFSGLLVLFTTGVSLLFAALNVKYRDTGYVVTFLLQIGIFVAPVLYQTQSIVPAKWRALYFLDPLAGVIEGYRWALLGQAVNWGHVLISLGAAVVVFWVGKYYFRKVENQLAEIV